MVLRGEPEVAYRGKKMKASGELSSPVHQASSAVICRACKARGDSRRAQRSDG